MSRLRQLTGERTDGRARHRQHVRRTFRRATDRRSDYVASQTTYVVAISRQSSTAVLGLLRVMSSLYLQWSSPSTDSLTDDSIHNDFISDNGKLTQAGPNHNKLSYS